MNLKKKEDQSVDASVLLRKGNKIITGGRGWEELGKKRCRRGEKGGRIRYGERYERGLEGQKNGGGMRLYPH